MNIVNVDAVKLDDSLITTAKVQYIFCNHKMLAW